MKPLSLVHLCRKQMYAMFKRQKYKCIYSQNIIIIWE